MAEEVSQNFTDETICGAKLIVDIRTQAGFSGESRYLRECVAYGKEDTIDLRVFILKETLDK